MKPILGHYFLAIIALSVTLSVAAISLFMRNSIAESVNESVTARQQVKVADFNRSKEDIFLSQYEGTVAEWAKLPALFVNSDNIVAFIESVEALGMTTGSTINLSAIYADDLESASPGTHGTMRATVRSEGSWSTMMRVLRMAESLPYSVTISDVLLEVTSRGAGPEMKKVWNLSFKLEASMIKSGFSGASIVRPGLAMQDLK